jgi:hypothetical protein
MAYYNANLIHGSGKPRLVLENTTPSGGFGTPVRDDVYGALDIEFEHWANISFAFRGEDVVNRNISAGGTRTYSFGDVIFGSIEFPRVSRDEFQKFLAIWNRRTSIGKTMNLRLWLHHRNHGALTDTEVDTQTFLITISGNFPFQYPRNKMWFHRLIFNFEGAEFLDEISAAWLATALPGTLATALPGTGE